MQLIAIKHRTKNNRSPCRKYNTSPTDVKVYSSANMVFFNTLDLTRFVCFYFLILFPFL